jgi:uncharacterized membrane protein
VTTGSAEMLKNLPVFFEGTPTFLAIQTLIVAVWILFNSLGYTKFDIYPFILLNLAFRLQAAYAAPLYCSLKRAI